MTESEIQHAIRLALGREPGLTLWRNNVGVANHADGRKTRYGLTRGSSDLIGVLSPSGRFVAFEIKTPSGTLTSEQHMFLALVSRSGGFSAVVRSVEDAQAALAAARTGATQWP